MRGIMLDLCVTSSSPYAMGIWYRLTSREDLEGLLKKEVSPFFYEWNGQLSSLAKDLQIHAFLKKHPGLDIPGVDKERTAYDKWSAAEAKCRGTNHLFRERWSGTSCSNPRVEAAISAARQKITDILGSFDECDDTFLVEHARHGPGADTTLPKSRTCGPRKWSVPGEITPAARVLYAELYPEHRVQDLTENASTTFTARLDFVPKTAFEYRSTEIGPRWNLYLQLAVGSLIEDRLAKRTHLTPQSQDANRELARRSYRENLATLDLSSASDCVSINLVIDLLADCDPRWLDLLLSLRVRSIVYDEKLIRVEKIAGMGNGYTFPLETLIFYALLYGVQATSGAAFGPSTVFGDDIICHQRHASALTEVLEYCGFVVNTAKSFTSGSFYESCGKDYITGHDVRPVYLKGRLTRVRDLYKLHNAWVRRGLRGTQFLDADSARLAGAVLAHIPPDLRFFGPQILGHAVLHAPPDFAIPSIRRPCPYQRFYAYRAIEEGWPKASYHSYYGLLYDKLQKLGQDNVVGRLRPDTVSVRNNVPDQRAGLTEYRVSQVETSAPPDEWWGYDVCLTAAHSSALTSDQ